MAHVPTNDVQEGNAGVLQQVPPIGDLQRLRGTLGGCFAIAAAAIAAHDLDAGTFREPVGDRASLPVRQEIDDPASLEIAQDRPIALSSPPGEIVDADDLDAGGRWRGAPAQDAEQRVRADRHGQALDEPRTRAAAKHQGNARREGPPSRRSCGSPRGHRTRPCGWRS